MLVRTRTLFIYFKDYSDYRVLPRPLIITEHDPYHHTIHISLHLPAAPSNLPSPDYTHRAAPRNQIHQRWSLHKPTPSPRAPDPISLLPLIPIGEKRNNNTPVRRPYGHPPFAPLQSSAAKSKSAGPAGKSSSILRPCDRPPESWPMRRVVCRHSLFNSYFGK